MSKEPRYFEITVMQGEFRKSHRWHDLELSEYRGPLGELLESEIESLRKSCELAALGGGAGMGEGSGKY